MLPTADPILLGILNSRLGYFYFSTTCASLEGGNERYLEFRAQYVRGFPVVAPKATGRASMERLEELVDLRCGVAAQLSSARNPDDKTKLTRRIDTIDRQIDQMVYELYGLSDAEIGIVEGAER